MHFESRTKKLKKIKKIIDKYFHICYSKEGNKVSFKGGKEMNEEFLRKLDIDLLMSSLVQLSYGLRKVKTEKHRQEVWMQINMIKKEIKRRCE